MFEAIASFLSAVVSSDIVQPVSIAIFGGVLFYVVMWFEDGRNPIELRARQARKENRKLKKAGVPAYERIDLIERKCKGVSYFHHISPSVRRDR